VARVGILRSVTSPLRNDAARYHRIAVGPSSVYCRGKREDDWSCHHEGTPPSSSRHDHTDQHITVEVLTCPRSIARYRYRCSVVWGSYPVRRWTIQITLVQLCVNAPATLAGAFFLTADYLSVADRRSFPVASV